MADILDELMILARTEDTGERWKGEIAMRAHDAISRLRAEVLEWQQFAAEIETDSGESREYRPSLKQA